MKKSLLLTIFLSFFTLFFSTSVNAGTNLTVTCNNEGPCDISPDSTPLFYELNIYPGYTDSEFITVFNLDVDEECHLYLRSDDVTPAGQPVNLAERIFTALHSTAADYYGTHTSTDATGGFAESRTLQDMYDDDHIYLTSVPAGGFNFFRWIATVDSSIDNSFQNVSTVFDFDATFSCGATLTPTPTPTTAPAPAPASSSSSSSSSSSGSGGTECRADAPTSAPILVATHNADNTVQLNWWPVNPVTHYALVFYRNSDGEAYGSTDIGNVTSYTVTHLDIGESYSFQVFGVNDCEPGPRSNTETIAVTSGLEIPPGERPLGPGGEVLGIEEELTPTPTLEIEEIVKEEASGMVAGVSECAASSSYLPWIILIVQIGALLIVEFVFRQQSMSKKFWYILAVTVLSNIVFYILRNCDCYADQTFLTWLCKWFFIPSLLETAVIRFIAYGFIEDIAGKSSSTK